MRIFIQGDLTKEELEEILHKVREIEQHDKKRRINITAFAPKLGFKTVMNIMRKIFPDWYEMNYCQICKTLYRKDEKHECK